MSDSPSSGSPGQAGWDGLSFTNIADTNPQAGAEFGILFQHDDIYETPDDQPPPERYRAGLRFLDAKVPRRAEELIGRAVAEGFRGDPAWGITVDHIAYHWTLSVLSGRSLDQLGDRQFDTIGKIKELRREDAGDPWLAPLNLVLELIEWLQEQERSGSQEAELGPLVPDIEAATREFPDKDREKFREKIGEDFERHLYLLLEDTSQEKFLTSAVRAADTKRMSHGREQRAWKFFEPEPEPPLVRRVTEPSFSRSEVITAASGFVLGGLGLGLSLYVITAASVIRGILLVLLLGFSGFAVYRSGIERLTTGGRLADKEKENGNPAQSRYSATYTLNAPVSSQISAGGSPPGGPAEQEAAEMQTDPTEGDQEAAVSADPQAAQAVRQAAQENPQTAHEDPPHVQVASDTFEAKPKAAEVAGTSRVALLLERFRSGRRFRFRRWFRRRDGTGQKGEKGTAETAGDATAARLEAANDGPYAGQAAPTTQAAPGNGQAAPLTPQPGLGNGQATALTGQAAPRNGRAAPDNSQAAPPTAQATSDTAETERQPAQSDPNATTAGQETAAQADPQATQADPHANQADPQATQAEPETIQSEPPAAMAAEGTAETGPQLTQPEQPLPGPGPQPPQPEPETTTDGQEMVTGAEAETAGLTGASRIPSFLRPSWFLRRFRFPRRLRRDGTRRKAKQGSTTSAADNAETRESRSLAWLLPWIDEQYGTGHEGKPEATQAGREAASQPQREAADRTEREAADRTEQEAADRAEREKAEARAAREAEQARRAIFRRVTSRHIDRAFASHAPQDPQKRREWEADTARLKETMREEFIGYYQGARPGSVNWLITWRVAQIAERYKARALFGYRAKLRPPGWARAVLPIGTAALLVGVLALLVGTFSSGIVIGLVVLILLPLGAVIVLASRLDVYLVLRHRLADDRADTELRFQREHAQFEKWKSELADRPTDAEIARWLDYDKLYLTNIALDHLGVSGRQLIRNVTLMEAAAGSRGARIIHGPPRYSESVVTIFLLTEVGLRRLVTRFDFKNGIPSDHVRQSFPYDAIARAGFREIGVRFDRDHEEDASADRGRTSPVGSVVPAQPTDGTRRPDGSAPLEREFVLTLATGEAIRFSVEKFDEDFRDVSREGQPELLDLALESSGIESALTVLETMAALGGDWLRRERKLRRPLGPPPPPAPGLRAVPDPDGSGPGGPPQEAA